MKIKKLEIKGLRGVKGKLTLDLSSKSALIYGDNGAGKSTIADAIEWYYKGKVEHLKGEEIGRSGLEALRHIDIDDDQSASASISLTDASLTSEKLLEVQNAQLKVSYSNNSDKFQRYITDSGNENLVLRYRDLTTFVLATKTQRLESLSAIIGYKDITGTLNVLKFAFNAIQRDIKLRDFPRIFGDSDQEIIEQYGQNVTSDEQFLEVTNAILKASNVDANVKSLSDVNAVLNSIGTPDNRAVKKEDFLNRVTNQLSSVIVLFQEIEEQYIEFFEKFSAIVSTTSKLKMLLLDKVLSSASELLENKAYTDNQCPVCLTEKDKAQLKADVDSRIAELAEIQAEQKTLSETKDAIIVGVSNLENALSVLLSDEQAEEDWFLELKQKINSIIVAAKKYDAAVKVPLSIDQKPVEKGSLLLTEQTTQKVYEFAKEQRGEARATLKTDNIMEVHSRINISGRAYASIRKHKTEQAKLVSQRDTLEVFYQEFSETQRTALQAFLDTFSGEIQAIYQFMNPGVKVENIKLVPLEKNDEMVGMTFQMDFFDHKDVSPPHKYLSESHLNCIGIAFFLASAEAYNKQNKFLIMDDVISSFDENHRKRFGDLLVEKFNHLQIIVLTHERGWFELLRNQVRGKGWIINTVKHSNERGTEFKPPPKLLRESIKFKIGEQDDDNLASKIRKYLEGLLKNVSQNLEVRVAFRFNEINEDRMASELLSGLQSQLRRRKCDELKDSAVIGRLRSSTFIGNKDSHDSAFVPGFADARAFWDDVCDFESLFFCTCCNGFVSTKYIDTVNNKIRCKAGDLTYTWKK